MSLKEFYDERTAYKHVEARVRPHSATFPKCGEREIVKRGMRGIYHHCRRQPLHCYAAEFDFRLNNRHSKEISDTVWADIALTNIDGKRLNYETVGK